MEDCLSRGDGELRSLADYNTTDLRALKDYTDTLVRYTLQLPLLVYLVLLENFAYVCFVVLVLLENLTIHSFHEIDGTGEVIENIELE